MNKKFVWLLLILRLICILKVVADDRFVRNRRVLHSDPNYSINLALSFYEQNIADFCLPEFRCNPAEKYRSFDGSCNNFLRTGWGIPNTAFPRLLPASYDDHIGSLRTSFPATGVPLPSPRVIHNELFPEGDDNDEAHTLAVMQWGQVVAHDVTLMSIHGGTPCCTADFKRPILNDPTCLPIFIPRDDPFYSTLGMSCMDMHRAKTTMSFGCAVTPLQQVSGTTHVLDASMVYGSSLQAANSLRTFHGGLLKSQVTRDGRHFLPNVQKPTDTCDVESDSDVCYSAGDGRVNQNIEIAVSQVMFLRLHNIIAQELGTLNPFCNDEIIFQETRRIIIAIIQLITYKEYLPVILGNDFVKERKLNVLEKGYAKEYNPEINPSTLSEFAGGAFRSFHSTIQNFINLVDEDRKVYKRVRLSDWMNSPAVIQKPGNFDGFIRGMITQPQQEQDEIFGREVSNFIFKSGPSGLDLLSLDINRGRDMGFPPYVLFLLLCGSEEIRTFDDLNKIMDKEKVSKLRQVYADVFDIDYLVGGLLERKIPGTLTSLSFQCIIAEAFYRYKYGDSFYFEFGGFPGSFTLDQLNMIRKLSFASIICLTSDNIQFVQTNVFLPPHPRKNPMVSCLELITDMDFNAWVQN